MKKLMMINLKNKKYEKNVKKFCIIQFLDKLITEIIKLNDN